MANHSISYYNLYYNDNIFTANEIKEEEWSVLTGIPPYLISYPTKC